MNKLEVGKIVNTHGLRGEVKIVPWTDFPEEFENIKTVYIDNETPLSVVLVKYQKNNIIVKFDEINDIDEALKLKGKVIMAERSELKELAEGEYFIADLIGLSVYDDKDNLIGKIKDVIRTGANDVYVVGRENEKDMLIPVIDSVVKKVDIEEGKVVIHIIEGLLDI